MALRRVDALEAGMRFMTWVFSEGDAFADEVRAFTGQIGMSWRDVEGALKRDSGALWLVKGIEQASSSMGPQIFA